MKLCPKCQKQFSDDANFCPVDAARLVPAEAQTSAADPLTARFTLGDRLGGSRTGTVHRATDKQTNAAVAVKIVAAAVTSLPGVAQRLERELKQIERVQSAGVAKVIASGKRGNDESWLAVELLDGAQTLAEAIGARGPIPLEQAAHLIEVVGEALIEAAQVGVVHRDLAPKNILFAGDQIKLINFSLPVPTTEKVPGVAEFVAPEQIDGKPVDQRSNLYSLGALYYYVLTGQTPHFGATPDEVHRAHANAAIKTPSSLAPVPAPVEAVIMRALDRSPTKRFLTVRQFVDEVSRIARGDKSDPKSTQPMGKVGSPGRPAKAELVQTLLGVRHGGGFAAPAITGPAAAAAAAAMQPSSPASTVAGIHPTPGHLSAPPMAQPVAVAAALAAPPPQTASGAATVMGVPSAAASPGLDPDRSPWAPPSTVPPAGVNAPPSMPAPVAPVSASSPIAPKHAAAVAPSAAPTIGPVAAAVDTAAPMAPMPTPMAPVLPQPPTVAPPKVANAAPAKAGEKDAKGKFRETMWFKKGDLDAQAAVAAAEERARTGKDAQDKADSLPMDERYKDDGSISRGDKEKYSLRTGATQMMSAMKDKDAASSMSGKVSEDALIGEMKAGRSMFLLFVGLGVIAIGAIIFLLMR